MTPRVIYFGCIGRSGHYFHAPGERVVYDPREIPERLRHSIDAVYPPDGRTPGRMYPPTGPQPEGLARVAHVDGWTVLAFWDRSVDKRMASNSAFVIEGLHDFIGAVSIAREAFPKVWARFPFSVTLDPQQPSLVSRDG